jgi:hypothetical protein
VTSLLIIIYFVVFIGVIVSEPVQHAPEDTGGLNLEQAHEDLHEAGARLHKQIWKFSQKRLNR